jgi:trimeric autotransporter adhesin
MKTKLLYLFLFAISISYAQIPTANLVARYDFSGGSLNDATANPAHFVATGSARANINDRFGNANGAISLNGDDLRRGDIEFNTTSSSPYLPRTISFWLKTTTNDSNVRIIYNDNDQTSMGDTDFIGLTAYLQNGKINASNRVGTNGDLFTHPIDISDGNWHHIVIQGYTTITGSTTSGQKSFSTFIHVDGVKHGASGYNVTGGNISPIVNRHSGNISFSRLKTTSLPYNNKYLDGIDEVLFYSRVLTDLEIVTMAADNGGGGSGNSDVYYVNSNATGNNDGTSWTDAYTDLQDALINVTSNGDQIWVTSGTYKPDVSDRDASFKVYTNLYGGFDGTETQLSDRDMSLIHTTNATILSEDLLNADDATVDFNDSTRDDNSKHVVEIFSNNIEINGLTIKDGYADDTGGDDRFGAGIFKNTSVYATTIKNCIIKNNVAFTGAGLSLTTTTTSIIIIDACIIENNLANTASGLDFHLSGTNANMNISVTNSLFNNNQTDDDSSKGRKGSGASAARLRAFFSNVVLNATLVNNTFANNNSLGTSNSPTDYPTVDITRASGDFGDITVSNNIFWGNTENGGITAKAIGRSSSNSLITTNANQGYIHNIFNNIDEDGFFLITGTTGTITVNPNFNSSFELTSSSPAVDSGNNTFITTTSDLLGNQRIFNTTVDRGAYEFGSTSLGVSDFETSLDKIKLYPNPTSGILNIQMKSPLNKATVFNIQGQKVIESSTIQFDVSNLLSGVYVIKIEDKNGSVSIKRFIKNN